MEISNNFAFQQSKTKKTARMVKLRNGFDVEVEEKGGNKKEKGGLKRGG